MASAPHGEGVGQSRAIVPIARPSRQTRPPEPALRSDAVLAVDLLIVGGEVLPALVALAALDRAPGKRVALATSASRFGGGIVEPCFVHHLEPAGMDVLAPAQVAQWEGFHLIRNARVEDHAHPIAGFAPEQWHAELAVRIAPELLQAGVPAPTIRLDGQTCRLPSGATISARAVLDLRRSPPLPVAPLVMIDDAAHFDHRSGLTLPMLGDSGERGDGIGQVFPMAAEWLRLRRVHFATAMAQVRFHARPVADGAHPLPSRFMPFDGVQEGVPTGSPHPLLPSSLPGTLDLALALADALAAAAAFGPESLKAALSRFALRQRERLRARRQLLEMVATASPSAWLDACVMGITL